MQGTATAVLGQVHVGEPLSFGGMTVFPLRAPADTLVDYVTLDEALETKGLAVEEVSEAGSVPELHVRNTLTRRVLLLEGEQLVGARQNRILNTSVLVPAHADMKVPVSCVEQGRWSYRGKQFSSSGSVSPSTLRRQLKTDVTMSLSMGRGHRSDQGKVWGEFSRKMACLDSTSDTMALEAAYESHLEQSTHFAEAFQQLPADSQGVAVAIGDKLVGIDLFDRPATFTRFWSKLLRGYVLDALEVETETPPPPPSPERVQQVLAAAMAAPFEPHPAAGDGQELRTQSEGLSGSILTCDGSWVHASLFPN